MSPLRSLAGQGHLLLIGASEKNARSKDLPFLALGNCFNIRIHLFHSRAVPAPIPTALQLQPQLSLVPAVTAALLGDLCSGS